MAGDTFKWLRVKLVCLRAGTYAAHAHAGQGRRDYTHEVVMMHMHVACDDDDDGDTLSAAAAHDGDSLFRSLLFGTKTSGPRDGSRGGGGQRLGPLWRRSF